MILLYQLGLFNAVYIYERARKKTTTHSVLEKRILNIVRSKMTEKNYDAPDKDENMDENYHFVVGNAAADDDNSGTDLGESDNNDV